MKKTSFLKKNGLSISLLVLFLGFWAGQALTGWQVYNDELMEDKGNPIPFFDYLTSGHFVSATFENWESEFLQMFIFVVFSIFLYQQGSPESNPMGEEDKKPNERKSPHWAVRQGGFIKWIYVNSLSITLLHSSCYHLLRIVGGVSDIIKPSNCLKMKTLICTLIT